jgi:hypothetical protein
MRTEQEIRQVIAAMNQAFPKEIPIDETDLNHVVTGAARDALAWTLGEGSRAFNQMASRLIGVANQEAQEESGSE